MTSPSVTDVHPSQSDLVCLLNRLNDWQATTPPTPQEIKAGTLVIWETRRRFQENRIPPLQIIASAMSWLCSTTCTTSFPQSHPNNRTRCRRAERENWGTMCLRVKGTLWCYYHFIRRFFFFFGVREKVWGGGCFLPCCGVSGAGTYPPGPMREEHRERDARILIYSV